MSNFEVKSLTPVIETYCCCEDRSHCIIKNVLPYVFLYILIFMYVYLFLCVRKIIFS